MSEPVEHTEHTEHPAGQHCSQCCPKKPDCDLTFSEGLIGFSFLGALVITALSFPIGIMNASKRDDCGPWFEKRWEFVVPLYQLGCKTGHWFQQDTHPKKESQDE